MGIVTNYMCKKCRDNGYIVGFFMNKKVCPVCNGDPRSQLPPKTPVSQIRPMAPCNKVVQKILLEQSVMIPILKDFDKE